jgi:hypothetical protein
MKRLLVIVVLVLGLTLSACKDDTPVCDDGYRLNDDNVCVPEQPTCEEGTIWNDETEQCDPIIETTPIESAIEAAAAMDNYQMNVTATQGDVTVNMTLLFDGHTSALTVGGTTEYFVQEGDVCTRVTEQLDNVITEDIDCIADNDTRFQFFRAFEADWFVEQSEGVYRIGEDYYDGLNNFFRTSIAGAVVTDFDILVTDDQFDTFTFVVTGNDSVTDFTITFTNIDAVTIEVPTGE